MATQSSPSRSGIDFMRKLDADYRAVTGLDDRKYYSIFYTIPAPADFLMLNANPGGSPDNYQIVDVEAGEHEYIEGAASGRTTSNGAELLRYLVGGTGPDAIRHVQVANIAFRRSRDKSRLGLPFAEAVREARPFVESLIGFIRPKALLFAGDANLHTFAKVHEAVVTAFPEETVLGPNGASQASYYARYRLALPYLGEVDAYTIYHPSKMNGFFRQTVFPRLRERLGNCLAEAVV